MLAALCALSALGCPAKDERPLRTQCDLPGTGSELRGQWTLHAVGKRHGCEDRGYQGELVIETSMPIEVTAEPQASTGPATRPTPDSIADAFVERIERAQYLLGLGDNAPAELALTGGTVGSCVSFTLTELLPDGDALVYDFDGAITDHGHAEGDLQGEGPAGCLVDGTFELEVR